MMDDRHMNQQPFNPYPPQKREFDYHRIPGADEAYRLNYDRIFRKTGYRILESGEEILPGDEYEAQYHPGVWIRVVHFGMEYNPARHNLHRRPL